MMPQNFKLHNNSSSIQTNLIDENTFSWLRWPGAYFGVEA